MVGAEIVGVIAEEGPEAGIGDVTETAGTVLVGSVVPPFLCVLIGGILKLGRSVVGKAENGPSLGFRLMGGRPRVLPVPPGLQADETTLAPCLLFEDLGLPGVIADLGSSAQKLLLVTGVIAECGYAVKGVCTMSEFVHDGPDGWPMLAALSLRGSDTGKRKTLPLPSG